MKPVIIHVQGISPLLTNNFAGMLRPRGPGGRSAQSYPGPTEEAELGTYRDVAGHLALPTSAFRKCAVNGGRGRKVGRSSLTAVLMGTLFAGDETTTLIDPQTQEPIDSYEVDTRRAVPPKQGAVLRSRPKIFPWSAYVHLEYDEEDIVEDTVRWALAQGGSKVGVGNFRPEKGGMFGRFDVLG